MRFRGALAAFEHRGTGTWRSRGALSRRSGAISFKFCKRGAGVWRGANGIAIRKPLAARIGNTLYITVHALRESEMETAGRVLKSRRDGPWSFPKFSSSRFFGIGPLRSRNSSQKNDREGRAKNPRAAGVPAGYARRHRRCCRVRLGEEPTETVVRCILAAASPTAMVVVAHGSIHCDHFARSF